MSIYYYLSFQCRFFRREDGPEKQDCLYSSISVEEAVYKVSFNICIGKLIYSRKIDVKTPYVGAI